MTEDQEIRARALEIAAGFRNPRALEFLPFIENYIETGEKDASLLPPGPPIDFNPRANKAGEPR